MRLLLPACLLIFSQLAVPSAVVANENTKDSCTVTTDSAGTLATARSMFNNSCANYTLVDCDPVDGGGWQCSSGILGANAPRGNHTVQSTSTVTTQDTTPEPASTQQSTAPTTQSITSPDDDSGECYAVANGLNQAKITFGQQCASYQRDDCDPLGNNRWVCSSANISNAQQYNTDSSLTTTASTSSSNNQSSNNSTTSSPTNSTTSASSNSQTNTSAGKLSANDLLVLHYDNCPDKDDGQAIPAGKSITEKLGINNVLVVNGTCGNSIRDRFNSASHAVVNASWGDNYLDADGQRTASVQAAATRWASTLSNGAHIWVAEGGQSDFTAEVVRRVQSLYANLNLKNIHVVQHSAGSTAYNEMFTDSTNLSYLKNTTSYQPIANGNVGGNGTADLNEQSSFFVATARASRFSAEWNAGFNYLPPNCSVRTENCKLDFSDTVEVLYIVNDTNTLSVNDFANTYLK